MFGILKAKKQPQKRPRTRVLSVGEQALLPKETLEALMLGATVEGENYSLHMDPMNRVIATRMKKDQPSGTRTVPNPNTPSKGPTPSSQS